MSRRNKNRRGHARPRYSNRPEDIKRLVVSEQSVSKNRKGNVTDKETTNNSVTRSYHIDYNENNNPEHYVSNYGYESWTKYNNRGNIAEYWDNTGYREVYTYYRNRHVVCETSEGEVIKRQISDEYPFVTRFIFRIICMPTT